MIQLLTANLSTNTLNAFGKDIDISCIVRNELNGWRKSNEIIFSVPDHKPVQPRPFPKGIWNVGKPVAREDPYLAPYYIPTDAWQQLPIWELTADRKYGHVTTDYVRDTAYGLHTSTSTSTQGCIKINNMHDLLWLVQYIGIYRDKGDIIKLKVV